MKPHQLDFNVDRLESRRMLAGDIGASITNAGDLILTGDELGNQAVVTLQDEQVLIQGVGGTTIEGQGSLTLGLSASEGLRDIKIKMNDGDDQISLNSTNSGSVRNIRANLGNGSDSLLVAYMVTTGSTSIKLGKGGAASQSATFSFSTFGKNLAVTGGQLSDLVTFDYGVSVNGKTRVNLGAGNDSLFVNYATATFSGKFTAIGGSGDDLYEDFGTYDATAVFRKFEIDGSE